MILTILREWLHADCDEGAASLRQRVNLLEATLRRQAREWEPWLALYDEMKTTVATLRERCETLERQVAAQEVTDGK